MDWRFLLKARSNNVRLHVRCCPVEVGKNIGQMAYYNKIYVKYFRIMCLLKHVKDLPPDNRVTPPLHKISLPLILRWSYAIDRTLKSKNSQTLSLTHTHRNTHIHRKRDIALTVVQPAWWRGQPRRHTLVWCGTLATWLHSPLHLQNVCNGIELEGSCVLKSYPTQTSDD